MSSDNGLMVPDTPPPPLYVLGPPKNFEDPLKLWWPFFSLALTLDTNDSFGADYFFLAYQFWIEGNQKAFLTFHSR